MFKKAQVSTEYLVILAVVLVVALVVVALVSGVTPVSSGVSETQSKNYWQSQAPISITAWKYASTTLDMTMQNNDGQKVTITGMTSGAGTAMTIPANSSFSVGETKTISATGMAACGDSGASFEITNVTITYSKGTITGLLQKGDKSISGKCS